MLTTYQRAAIFFISLGISTAAWSAPAVSSVGSMLTTPTAVHLKVPFCKDRSSKSGPATLTSVLTYWGKPQDVRRIKREIYVPGTGTLPTEMYIAAKQHGLAAVMVRGDLNLVRQELRAAHPVIAMVHPGLFSSDSFVVITGFDDQRQGLYVHTAGRKNLFIAYTRFISEWDKVDRWTLTAQPPVMVAEVSPTKPTVALHGIHRYS